MCDVSYNFAGGGLILENKKSGLVFFSSPHPSGYTGKLLNLFMKNAPQYRFNIINCYKRKIAPCIDCGYCKKQTGCSFDDMDDIDTHLRTSDLLVFCSPVYNFSFPASMKLLLDRMQRYFSARFSLNISPPINKKKKGVLLLSCGSEDTRGLEIMQLQLKKIFTVINCELIDTILLKDTDKLNNFDDSSILKKVENVANNL